MTRKVLRRQRVTSDIRAIFLGDLISNEIILSGTFETHELNCLARTLFATPPPLNSTALDIGANIGNHAIYFARYFQRVIAFEPNPMVACVLRANTFAAGNKVEVAEIGLSETQGQLNFRVNEDNLGGSGVTDSETGMTIDVVTLDSMVAPMKIQNVKFIKLDVEGHEEQVLKGASELISASKPTIAFEGHYKQYPDQWPPIARLLSEYGYRYVYRFTDTRTGGARILRKITPKPLRREGTSLVLKEARPTEITNTNHSMLIATIDPIG